jgi:hypothetical protein
MSPVMRILFYGLLSSSRLPSIMFFESVEPFKGIQLFSFITFLPVSALFVCALIFLLPPLLLKMAIVTYNRVIF